MGEIVTINGVNMRKNTIGTAILLSIVTLGIYWLILVYRNTMDLHKSLGKDATLAVILYIAGFALPLFWIALFSINGIRLNELREDKKKQADMTWIVALVLHFVLAFVGSIVWAYIYDNVLDDIGDSPKATDFTHVA